MLSKVLAGTNVGLDTTLVTVEVDIANQGLPSFTIVGLPDQAVNEAKERVRSALKNSGADFPAKRITVNLAPADVQKSGPNFDLAIALGILISSGQMEADLTDTLVLGELSLDGSLRPINGGLSAALMAKNLNLKKFFLPKPNASEAAVIKGVEVYPLENLREVFQFLSNQIEVLPVESLEISLEDEGIFEYDFSAVKGQEQSKRALEIAASGAHNVLMKGPPGTGKTMLARSFASILPPLSLNEAIEVTKIYSVSGNLSGNGGLLTQRPFRSPHHTASYVGLIGGGNNIRPGEISLAHRGVLFLDELPEFPRQVLEALRQPLEDKKVSISRSSGSLSFPAQFILIATSNPCPCGFLGTVGKTCVCMPGQISRYQKKISGPMLDRIDIHLEVPSVEMEKLVGDTPTEDSKTIRQRVKKARQVQAKRFEGFGFLTNSEMNNAQIREFCKLGDEALDLLKLAILNMNLSARSYHRVLKVSRTIADLDLSEDIKTEHVAEALLYRLREEN